MATDMTVPRHIAVIMDGNGRWAKKRFLPRAAGHKAGFKRFVETVGTVNGLGLEYFTVYAFSNENWNRSVSEVSALMELMSRGIVDYVPELAEKNIRLRLLGDMKRFEPQYRNMLLDSEEVLSANTGMVLSVCLSYGGRQEITHAVNELIHSGRESVTEADISEALYTRGIPDPDLVIRTSGEYRISNFLLWQSAYAEYYFTDVYWPDFDKKELFKAIEAFNRRERRFGR